MALCRVEAAGGVGPGCGAAPWRGCLVVHSGGGLLPQGRFTLCRRRTGRGGIRGCDEVRTCARPVYHTGSESGETSAAHGPDVPFRHARGDPTLTGSKTQGAAQRLIFCSIFLRKA